MNYFSVNLKYLRKSKSLTQDEFGKKLGLNRSIIGSYEEGRAEPKLKTLQNISHYFKVSLDDLLELEIEKADSINAKDISGQKLRILPIVVNEDQKEKITLVPVKAAAGYLYGFNDQEYIEELKHFNLPLETFKNGTFRAFQIKGDSMLPIPIGSFIIAKYVENWNWIKDYSCYVVISKNEGIVYKRLVNKIESSNSIQLLSDNPSYEAFSLHTNDILEVWQACGYITTDLPERATEKIGVNQLTEVVMQLKQEVENLKKDQ